MKIWATQIGADITVWSKEPRWDPYAYEWKVPRRLEVDICAAEMKRLGVVISEWPKVTELEITAQFSCEWEPSYFEVDSAAFLP